MKLSFVWFFIFAYQRVLTVFHGFKKETGKWTQVPEKVASFTPVWRQASRGQVDFFLSSEKFLLSGHQVNETCIQTTLLNGGPARPPFLPSFRSSSTDCFSKAVSRGGGDRLEDKKFYFLNPQWYVLHLICFECHQSVTAVFLREKEWSIQGKRAMQYNTHRRAYVITCLFLFDRLSSKSSLRFLLPSFALFLAFQRTRFS